MIAIFIFDYFSCKQRTSNKKIGIIIATILSSTRRGVGENKANNSKRIKQQQEISCQNQKNNLAFFCSGHARASSMDLELPFFGDFRNQCLSKTKRK